MCLIIDLSIIIINHNTKKLTVDLIKSIYKNTILTSYEVIIIDNSDIESQKLKKNELDCNILKISNIIYTSNDGFGVACNKGAKLSKGRYLLFINSDIIFSDNAIDKSINYIKKDKNIGALGCKVILKDGSLDHGCKRGFPSPSASLYYFLHLDKIFPKSKKFGAYRLSYLNNDEIHEVDAISGSFLIINAKLFFDINGFDETFFMYGEDLDLCFRVKKRGFKIIYYPLTSVTHLKGQSRFNKNKFVLYHFYNAMVIFYNKHYKSKHNFKI